MRRPGSEDPYRRQWKFICAYTKNQVSKVQDQLGCDPFSPLELKITKIVL
jgi:hypothetical protein